MFTKDENYLSMARNVGLVLQNNEKEWAVLPKFVEFAKDFYNIMGITSKEKSSADIETTGSTIDKESAGNYAIDYADKITKRATNYALETQNMELKDQLKIYKSELQHGHDSQIVDKLIDVLNRMKGIVGKLKDYGVSDKELKKLEEAISVYNGLLDRPRELIVERKGHNTMAVESLSKVKELIEKMDNAINYFENSKFEMDYENARIVIDLGTRKGKGDKDDKKPPKDTQGE